MKNDVEGYISLRNFLSEGDATSRFVGQEGGQKYRYRSTARGNIGIFCIS